MTEDVSPLIDELRRLEQEIERRLQARTRAVGLRIEGRRVVFEKALVEHHRAMKARLGQFLKTTPLIFYLTAPVIYAVIIPIAFLDIALSVYQAICFRAWGIARAPRADFIVLDRRHLAYLNSIQKLNCTYCSYANGVIAYAREIAGRTEQFWCPIKHAIRTRGTHERYRDFLSYGDATGFVRKSDAFRARLKDLDQSR